MNDNLRKLIENERTQSENRVNKALAEELTPQGDLLPPWRKFPEIQAGSMGWRMGYGEVYMRAWDKWASQWNKEQLLEYFKSYLPIPLDWLPWVSICFGDTTIAHEFFSGGSDFAGIHWLEQQGLANFGEFKSWYDNWYDNWKRQKDRES